MILGSGPSRFEATRQPSNCRPETEDEREDVRTTHSQVTRGSHHA